MFRTTRSRSWLAAMSVAAASAATLVLPAAPAAAAPPGCPAGAVCVYRAEAVNDRTILHAWQHD